MKSLKIQKSELARGLSAVSKTVGEKGVIPILGNILLESDGERLKLGSTNLEIAMSCEVDAIEAEEFSTTVPAKLFSDLIDAIRADEILFEYDQENLTLKVKTETSNNNIRCLDPKDFPDLPVFPEESTLSMPPETFRRLIQRSVFSASSSESAQPLYAGILFESRDGELAIVSTDSFRFSVEKIQVKSADFSVVIPAKWANEFARVSEADVEMAVLEKSIVLRSGDVVCGILSLGGEYPKLRDFNIDTKDAVEVVAGTEEFYKAVKHASIFCPEEKRTLELDFKLISEISAQADQVGDSVVSLPLEVNGEAKIHLNADFLMGVLGVAGEKVRILVSGEKKPVLVKLEGVENYLHVMMPIKV